MSEPKLITRQSLAAEAPRRWLSQYANTRNEKHQAITSALAALPVPIDPDEVDRIIGNTSWTTPHYCSACDAYPPVVVQVGQEPDYESSTAYLCGGCLRQALALLEAKEQA